MAGNLIHYSIQSFPVFNAILREVNFHLENECENLYVFDVCAREWHCILLDHQLPSVAKHAKDLCSYDNAFVIEVCKSFHLYSHHLHNIACFGLSHVFLPNLKITPARYYLLLHNRIACAHKIKGVRGRPIIFYLLIWLFYLLYCNATSLTSPKITLALLFITCFLYNGILFYLR